MLKLGFAACSTLTLGWVSLLTEAPWEGCTGGGILGPAACSNSSFKSTESSILLLIGLCVEDVGWRKLWVTVSSFCGGTGGWSTVAGALSPSGPNGPRESSRASSRTGCAPARRVGLECREAGDLTVACVVGEVSVVGVAFGRMEASVGYMNTNRIGSNIGELAYLSSHQIRELHLLSASFVFATERLAALAI
jgi:hypothetical protein